MEGLFVLFILVFAIAVIFPDTTNAKNRPVLDKNGTMHCTKCGCTSFLHRFEGKETVYECDYCGTVWARR
jgi:hypothetical protein